MPISNPLGTFSTLLVQWFMQCFWLLVAASYMQATFLPKVIRKEVIEARFELTLLCMKYYQIFWFDYLVNCFCWFQIFDMYLCIVGIIWFIALFVDINRYIFAMKKFWKKGGKHKLFCGQNYRQISIIDFEKIIKIKKPTLFFRWPSEYRVNRKWRWRVINKYSNTWGTARDTWILWIFKRKTFWFILLENWRRYLLCHAYSSLDPPHCERSINYKIKLIYNILRWE